MFFLVFAFALLLTSTASAAPVILSTSEPTRVTVMVTTFLKSTPTPLQLATVWPTVQARQWDSAPVWSEPAPVWTEPDTPVWSKLAVWIDPAAAPTVTSYFWTDAISYSYTNTPTSATATPTPSYAWEETHRPALSAGTIGIIVGIICAILFAGGFLWFSISMIRGCIYRRHPRTPPSPKRDSDIEMAADLPSKSPPPAHSTHAPAARVPSVHSFVNDGFQATPVQGHSYIPTRKPVPAHGSSLPVQPTHRSAGEIEQHNVTWTRGQGYRQLA